MSAAPEYEIPFATFHNIINNQLSDTEESHRNLSPSTGEPLWLVPVSTQDDVDRAVTAAQAAFPSWSKLSYDERAAYLNKFVAAVEANKDELTKLIGQELGKTPQFAAYELDHLQANTVVQRTAIVRHIPLGVAVGIVPWNFPLGIGLGKLLPALPTGNTFIWKPSPHAPYSTLKMAEIGAQVFPPGVFQALSETTSTGSVETGGKVMAACAATLKRITLELGGNDAAIGCCDADIESVAAKLAFFSFMNSGQICMAVKRIYVYENIYDPFLATIVAITKQFKAGDYSDTDAFFGSIQNSVRYEKLQTLYSQIEADRAANVEGSFWGGGLGSKQGTGFHMPATIIDNPPDDPSIVTDEPFCPIVPVLKWKDDNDMTKRANAPSHGLGASVWSKDVARARRIGDQLEAGSIWVDTHFEFSPNVPFGGHEQSGLGTEWGTEGLKGCCNTQAYWFKH
ncbi:hypothetical protein PFICI_12886 [Pestalotiopsis fici W106-1]|uniref:aldehyde dehydrogenase (NAD(+)) n=1 Tax=Pestalotiopsis fici (strain W106-1 / CGMCC3.15140) TaxID=1229662 RepID=W3WS10_PESFW|nr:uncharacterized protein PFICI_12886 [Pestalotiopsis fici W106-1]ETS75942.1 hypothetical protein PFICI_12886 [Pestalotiopsis fici W106-1]